jgi:RNA polymerase sigma-70 factor (ECF subfamily)
MPLPGLPEEQREVILLVGLEGLRYAEAAVILSVPIGTVRSRLSRARDTLRKLLDRVRQELSSLLRELRYQQRPHKQPH